MEKIVPEVRRMYYQHLFPVTPFVHWLSHGSENQLRFREFAFTLPIDSSGKDTIIERWQSFDNEKQLFDTLVKKNPLKIDVGSLYSYPPAENRKRSGDFHLKAKELIFDIDASDYDDVRWCCKKTNMCEICWGFLQSAVEVLDAALRIDFGYTKLLWVWSGRRGMHCWVSDEKAYSLVDPTSRGAIVSYLSLNEEDLKGCKGSIALHPALERAYKKLLPYAEKLQLLRSEANRRLLQRLVPPRYHSMLLWKPQEEDKKSAQAMWNHFTRRLFVLQQQSIPTAPTALEDFRLVCLAPKRFILQTMYPRLDAAVSISSNHLLKSPFSIHPETGKVCLVVDPRHISRCNPFTAVPTVQQLLDDMNRKGEAPFLQTFRNSVKFFARQVGMTSRASVVDVEDLVPLQPVLRSRKRKVLDAEPAEPSEPAEPLKQVS